MPDRRALVTARLADAMVSVGGWGTTGDGASRSLARASHEAVLRVDSRIGAHGGCHSRPAFPMSARVLPEHIRAA
jgi:hypothetical protein